MSENYNENSRKNLKNISENITPEQRHAASVKGGKKSGESRRRKRDMRELVCDILEMNIKDGKAEDFKNLAESKGKNVTVSEALVLAQIKKALGGDTRALEFLRDTAGMKPTEKQEVTATIKNEGKLDEILRQLNE